MVGESQTPNSVVKMFVIINGRERGQGKWARNDRLDGP